MATHLHSLRNLSENRNLNTVFCSSGKDKMLKRSVIGTKIIIQTGQSVLYTKAFRGKFCMYVELKVTY